MKIKKRKMVSSSKQRRATSKEAKERMNESTTATAAAELAANIQVEVNDDANESVALNSVRDTPPPSDLEDIEEDYIDVEKSINSRKSVEPINDNSERSIDDELSTEKDTAKKRGMKNLLIER